MEKIQAIVLAAGKGTRMNKGKSSPIPKVMFELGGKPMIDYSLVNLKKAGFFKPIVVIGYKGEIIEKHLGSKAFFAWQKKRLGTAHAVSCAKKAANGAKTILVIGGDDSAFYEPEMIEKLVKDHLQSGVDMTLLTVEVADPKGLGRIVKNSDGNVEAIVEEKLATPSILKIKEINTGCYVFEASFLWLNLKKVKKNPTGEYFLTDLVEIANKGNFKVKAYKTRQANWHGINTLEQLEAANVHMRKALK